MAHRYGHYSSSEYASGGTVNRFCGHYFSYCIGSSDRGLPFYGSPWQLDVRADSRYDALSCHNRAGHGWMDGFSSGSRFPEGRGLDFCDGLYHYDYSEVLCRPYRSQVFPIGLLVLSAGLAVVGLLFLGLAPAGIMVVAAIVYAFGKTFLWSTTLGVVSEQFPRGGALTLNGVSAVGVLGMGILGTPLMGLFLDEGIDADLREQEPALHAIVDGGIRSGMFGETPSLNMAAVDALDSENAAKLGAIVNTNKKRAFFRQAMLPGFLFVSYLALFLYFKSKGGYKPVSLD